MGDGFGGGDVDMSIYVWKLKRPVFGVYSLISFGYSISQLLSCLIVYYLQFGMLYGRLNMFKLIHNFIASQLTCLCVQFTVQDFCEHTFYTYDWLLSFCSWSNSGQDSLSSINTPLTHHSCLKTICIQIDLPVMREMKSEMFCLGRTKSPHFCQHLNHINHTADANTLLWIHLNGFLFSCNKIKAKIFPFWFPCSHPLRNAACMYVAFRLRAFAIC